MAFLFKFHAAFKRKSFRNRARAWLVLKIGAKMFQNSVPLTERQAGTTNDAASAWKPLPTRTPESPVEIEASGASGAGHRLWWPAFFVGPAILPADSLSAGPAACNAACRPH